MGLRTHSGMLSIRLADRSVDRSSTLFDCMWSSPATPEQQGSCHAVFHADLRMLWRHNRDECSAQVHSCALLQPQRPAEYTSSPVYSRQSKHLPGPNHRVTTYTHSSLSPTRRSAEATHSGGSSCPGAACSKMQMPYGCPPHDTDSMNPSQPPSPYLVARQRISQLCWHTTGWSGGG